MRELINALLAKRVEIHDEAVVSAKDEESWNTRPDPDALQQCVSSVSEEWAPHH